MINNHGNLFSSDDEFEKSNIKSIVEVLIPKVIAFNDFQIQTELIVLFMSFTDFDVRLNYSIGYPIIRFHWHIVTTIRVPIYRKNNKTK